jgi:PEP-CTERM motif
MQLRWFVRVSCGIVLAAMVFGAREVVATPILEVGDAGSLPATAQVALGTGSLTSISGVISPGTDVDFYLIALTGGQTFSATTVGGAVFDTELFLFDAAGFGVYANDDFAGFLAPSTLPAGDPLTPSAAGLYYLAISQCCNEASNALGLIFNLASNNNGLFGPIGPGGAGIVTSFSGSLDQNPGGGEYTIFLTGAEFVSPADRVVPEPTSLVLLATGIAGLFGQRKLRLRSGGTTGTIRSRRR